MFCAPPPPPVVGGGDDEDVDWVARGLSSSGGGSIVASTLRRCRRRCRRRGEAAGGGREARGIPGRGEENEYRGQKVQGGVEVDEAQHGREEEEGGRVGGWAAGPGGGGRARARRATAMAGDWTTALRMPPRCVSEGGLSSRHLSIYP